MFAPDNMPSDGNPEGQSHCFSQLVCWEAATSDSEFIWIITKDTVLT